jgi:hypothetical protein
MQEVQESLDIPRESIWLYFPRFDRWFEIAPVRR